MKLVFVNYSSVAPHTKTHVKKVSDVWTCLRNGQNVELPATSQMVFPLTSVEFRYSHNEIQSWLLLLKKVLDGQVVEQRFTLES